MSPSSTSPRVAAIPFTPTLPVLLRRAAALYGDREFVVVDEQRLTFVEAEQMSADLARRLLAEGVGKGTRLGIALPTSTEWAVSWLAAARIGAFPMLLPATYRAPELRRALRITDVGVLIAARTMLGRDYEAVLEEAVSALPDAAGPVIHDSTVPYLRSILTYGGSARRWAINVALDGAGTADVSEELLRAVESEVSPADALLAILTSGSSADPKVVVHTHGSAIRKVQGELGMGMPSSFPGRTYCAMPFFWVGGPQELLGALHSGATVVTQAHFDAAGVAVLLERERCISMAGWRGVLERVQSDPAYATRDLRGVRSALDAPALSSRGDRLNYGMTETFGPHANREWFDYKVVDPESGRSLPDGEVGEFCVRGFALMAGMYKKEREEVFDADGWYHTGDRGYIEDGRIWFRGRYSEMIKAGGANVSPLEVEEILGSFEDVASAYVFGAPDAAHGEVVAAVVVAAQGSSLDVQDLRDRLGRELSRYKVPSRWKVLGPEEVPYLASGKIDKRSLRALI